MDEIVSPEQSTFIKGRQILNDPLMVSEIFNWYKRKKRKLMIFKVDFEKAYDSLSWEYLDRVMYFLGFPNKWRSWIQACLVLARSSVLINGSATQEFNFERGLRQGDPLSPFLFINAMQGLHVILEDAVANRLFRAAKLGNLMM